MSISDAMMLRYYELLTDEDVRALRAQIESGAAASDGGQEAAGARAWWRAFTMSRRRDASAARASSGAFNGASCRSEIAAFRVAAEVAPSLRLAEVLTRSRDGEFDERGAALDPAGSGARRRRAHHRRSALRRHPEPQDRGWCAGRAAARCGASIFSARRAPRRGLTHSVACPI